MELAPFPDSVLRHTPMTKQAYAAWFGKAHAKFKYLGEQLLEKGSHNC